MKNLLKWASGMCVIAMSVSFTVANAQTVANGPYYATPSWDQTLPVSTRFIVLSNMQSNAVLDRETGLVWERSPSTLAQAWFNARNRCLFSRLGHRHGWRLPTISELTSLFDGDPANVTNPRLPPGHPFLNVGESYWTVNGLLSDINVVSVFNFFDGVFMVGTKTSITDLHRAWCVRGGAGPDLL